MIATEAQSHSESASSFQQDMVKAVTDLRADVMSLKATVEDLRLTVAKHS